MNRKFVAALTPARARLLIGMSELTKMEIDDSIRDLAFRDCVSQNDLHAMGICDPLDCAAVQFILDTDFRCGMPTMTSEAQRGEKIVKAAMAIGHIDECVTIEGFGDHVGANTIVGTDYETLAPHRHKLLIMDVADANPDGLDLVAKMFPRIIATGAMSVERSFSLGIVNAASSRMGSFLYPAVYASLDKIKWPKNSARGLYAMGVFPHLLRPITTRHSTFCLPVQQYY